MKNFAFAIILLSGTLLAQSGPATTPATAPSYSQLHCSGFVTREAIPRTNFVIGSKESPHEDQYGSRSQLLLGGPSLVQGQRYSILRQVDDPNHEDSSPLQRKKLHKLGALYQEIGWVTVQSVEKDVSVATFDFACDTTVRGDIIVPFKEKPAIAARTIQRPVESFRGSVNGVTGQILGSKNFDGLLGDGQIVYTDFGAAKGIKPGDYLLVLRGYAPEDLNKIERASEGLPKGLESTTVNPAHVKHDAESRFPHRVIGELLVLSATPESSTAIIARSLLEIELGDIVQSENPSAEPAKEAAKADSAPCQPASRLHRITHLQLHACQ